MSTYRVLLVDDHSAFREPLAFMFEREPDFEVVGQADSLAEARRVLGIIENEVDLAVVDLDLPDGDGTELVGELRAANPRAIVLVLTASIKRETHARAVEAGAAGVLDKTSHIGEVIEASRRLVAGESILSPEEVVELLQLADRRRERDREAEHRTTHAPGVGGAPVARRGPERQGDRRTPVRRQRHGAQPRREHLRQARGALEAAGSPVCRALRSHRCRVSLLGRLTCSPRH